MDHHIIELTSIRHHNFPTKLYVRADSLISWCSNSSGITEIAVDGVPFPIIVSDTPDEIMDKIRRIQNRQ